MAKITVAGEAVVITSSVKLKDIQTLAKHQPEALALYDCEDGKKNVVFKAGISIDNPGKLTKFGASFGSMSHDGNGFATITMSLPACLDDEADVKAYVANELGGSLMKLNDLEEQIAKAVETVETNLKKVEETISIL